MFDYFSYLWQYFFYLSFDILRRITTFSEPHSVLFFCRFGTKVTSHLKFIVLTSLSTSCVGLSQPMGKTEFSSTAENRTNCF